MLQVLQLVDPKGHIFGALFVVVVAITAIVGMQCQRRRRHRGWGGGEGIGKGGPFSANGDGRGGGGVGGIGEGAPPSANGDGRRGRGDGIGKGGPSSANGDETVPVVRRPRGGGDGIGEGGPPSANGDEHVPVVRRPRGGGGSGGTTIPTNTGGWGVVVVLPPCETVSRFAHDPFGAIQVQESGRPQTRSKGQPLLMKVPAVGSQTPRLLRRRVVHWSGLLYLWLLRGNRNSRLSQMLVVNQAREWIGRSGTIHHPTHNVLELRQRCCHESLQCRRLFTRAEQRSRRPPIRWLCMFFFLEEVCLVVPATAAKGAGGPPVDCPAVFAVASAVSVATAVLWVLRVTDSVVGALRGSPTVPMRLLLLLLLLLQSRRGAAAHIRVQILIAAKGTTRNAQIDTELMFQRVFEQGRCRQQIQIGHHQYSDGRFDCRERLLGCCCCRRRRRRGSGSGCGGGGGKGGHLRKVQTRQGFRDFLLHAVARIHGENFSTAERCSSSDLTLLHSTGCRWCPPAKYFKRSSDPSSWSMAKTVLFVGHPTIWPEAFRLE